MPVALDANFPEVNGEEKPLGKAVLQVAVYVVDGHKANGMPYDILTSRICFWVIQN